jgi:hypothetical protein
LTCTSPSPLTRPSCSACCTRSNGSGRMPRAGRPGIRSRGRQVRGAITHKTRGQGPGIRHATAYFYYRHPITITLSYRSSSTANRHVPPRSRRWEHAVTTLGNPVPRFGPSQEAEKPAALTRPPVGKQIRCGMAPTKGQRAIGMSLANSQSGHLWARTASHVPSDVSGPLLGAAGNKRGGRLSSKEKQS